MISTRAAPEPAGHYSQAVVEGGFIFLAGQLPVDPATGEIAGPDDIESQTRQVLRNVEAILQAAGSGLDRLVSVTIFVTSRSQWPEVDRVYADMLGPHRPARAVIPVPELRPGCLIEVQAIAAAGPVA
ncbi:MAG TPA: RidA family protein [Gemmatimonadales bacterium]|nr:RidA family protein [Gemmatimonadales bacterium]